MNILGACDQGRQFETIASMRFLKGHDNQELQPDRVSEDEMKFGWRQVGGRETINYQEQRVVGRGSAVCLTRGCASSQAVRAPRDL